MAQVFVLGYLSVHAFSYMVRVISVATLMGIILSLNLYFNSAIFVQEHHCINQTMTNGQMKVIFGCKAHLIH
jgi:hypothetical protein